MQKTTILVFIIFLASCSPYYLYNTSSQQKSTENKIESLNQLVTATLNSNVLERDLHIKDLLKRSKYRGNIATEIDLLNSDYIDLQKRFRHWEKSKKTNAKHDFTLYQDMSNFLRNSDLIGNSYQNITQGNRLVYDIFTKKNLFFLGFYRRIDNVEEYREFAKKYIRGAREYEELRLRLIDDIANYRTQIFQYGLKQDESRIAKLTHNKKFCDNPNIINWFKTT